MIDPKLAIKLVNALTDVVSFSGEQIKQLEATSRELNEASMMVQGELSRLRRLHRVMSEQLERHLPDGPECDQIKDVRVVVLKEHDANDAYELASESPKTEDWK